jgi:hypothetical protein
VPEIAQRLDIGRMSVYAMLERGILPGIRLGRRTWHAYKQWEHTCAPTNFPPTNLFHRGALPAWDLANTEPSPPRLARLRLPQTLEELQLALEMRTKQYLNISFSPELAGASSQRNTGRAWSPPCGYDLFLRRFRPRAQATVQSAPTVRHGRRQTASATAGRR